MSFCTASFPLELLMMTFEAIRACGNQGSTSSKVPPLKLHRNYGYFTHYLHYHYMALSYFIIFLVNRSTSLLSQFSACCWPVAIHRSLLDLTRSRWLHQECSAHHGNLRPAGNAMRTTRAMIDLFRIAEISICLDIEKHTVCVYIYTYSICIWLDVNACMSFFPFCKWKQLWINTEGCWSALYWQILTI